MTMEGTPAQTDNTRVIDQLVIAYNAGNARGFADLFTEDAVHGNLHGDGLQTSREEIYRRYVEVFGTFPENRTEVIHRIAFDHFVIDHERVKRSANSEPFDVVAIYTMKDGLIARCDFVRK
jgi:uncharacterized protein (TIGR02246 family)